MSARCSICKKPAVAAYRPFCSKRCADVDLSRWMKGVYAVPGVDGEASAVLAARSGDDAESD